jgi:hypothetical protein
MSDMQPKREWYNTDAQYRMALDQQYAQEQQRQAAERQTRWETDRMMQAANNQQSYGSDRSSSGGSCFVATAVYGDTHHADVETLRQFRDRLLLTNRPGRLMVRFYYWVGPILARWVVILGLRDLIRQQLSKLAEWLRVRHGMQ